MKRVFRELPEVREAGRLDCGGRIRRGKSERLRKNRIVPLDRSKGYSFVIVCCHG
jgi:hypothetical protein